MRLQSRIFLFFACSLVVSLVVSVSVFLNLLGRENRLFANPVISNALDTAFLRYRDADLDTGERLDYVMTELQIISRETSRFSILRKDLFLKAGNALALSFMLQLFLFGLLSFFLSRAVTRPWARIYSGLRELEEGNGEYRFSAGGDGEFFRLARRLNSLLDTIRENERKLAEQSNLLGWNEAATFLAHQFRNPLAAITLSGKNISLLTGKKDPDRELVAENVRIVEEETQRLSGLMTRLRELTSFETLRTVPLLLSDLFRKAAGRYESAAVDIAFSGESSGPFPFDVQYMEQLFFNLVNNTMEASAELDIRPSVIIGFKGCMEYESAEFSDAVTGLDPSILDKITQPRFTTRRTGTGLGIHIVRKIVSLHGGAMTIELSPAGGLVFSMKFLRRLIHE